MSSEMSHVEDLAQCLAKHTADPHCLPSASEQVIKDVKGIDYSTIVAFKVRISRQKKCLSTNHYHHWSRLHRPHLDRWVHASPVCVQSIVSVVHPPVRRTIHVVRCTNNQQHNRYQYRSIRYPRKFSIQLSINSIIRIPIDPCPCPYVIDDTFFSL